jgi:hypothetical protein
VRLDRQADRLPDWHLLHLPAQRAQCSCTSQSKRDDDLLTLIMHATDSSKTRALLCKGQPLLLVARAIAAILHSIYYFVS